MDATKLSPTKNLINTFRKPLPRDFDGNILEENTFREKIRNNSIEVAAIKSYHRLKKSAVGNIPKNKISCAVTA